MNILLGLRCKIIDDSRVPSPFRPREVVYIKEFRADRTCSSGTGVKLETFAGHISNWMTSDWVEPIVTKQDEGCTVLVSAYYGGGPPGLALQPLDPVDLISIDEAHPYATSGCAAEIRKKGDPLAPIYTIDSQWLEPVITIGPSTGNLLIGAAASKHLTTGPVVGAVGAEKTLTCPQCGHEGHWVNLGLVCPQHGTFF